MKTMIVIIGLLTILAGVLPFLDGFEILPATVPTSGPVYSGIIILIGVIGLLYANKKFGLLASQKFIVSVLALLIIFGGIIPFISSMNLLPSYVPSSGSVYSGIIILIGVIAVFYGKKQF